MVPRGGGGGMGLLLSCFPKTTRGGGGEMPGLERTEKGALGLAGASRGLRTRLPSQWSKWNR